jgi:hypothetical protein
MTFKYKLRKKKDEINLYFNTRKSFIELMKPKNNKQLKLYEMYSHVLVNMIFLKCKYSEGTESVIKKFLKNHKSKFKNDFFKNS